MSGHEILPGIRALPEKALLIKEINAIIIADLHLGYETMIEKEGVAFPRFQTKEMIQSIKYLVKKHEPDTIIFNGDIKHDFSRNTPQEWQDVRQLLEEIGALARLKFIKGNHDNFLATILAKEGYEISGSLMIENFVFSHGHEPAPSSNDNLVIIGHEHPAIQMSDEVGARARFPCFLHALDNNIIVLPAFSQLVSGRDILRPPIDKYISPPLEGASPEKLKVLAVAGHEVRDFGRAAGLAKLNE